MIASPNRHLLTTEKLLLIKYRYSLIDNKRVIRDFPNTGSISPWSYFFFVSSLIRRWPSICAPSIGISLKKTSRFVSLCPSVSQLHSLSLLPLCSGYWDVARVGSGGHRWCSRTVITCISCRSCERICSQATWKGRQRGISAFFELHMIVHAVKESIGLRKSRMPLMLSRRIVQTWIKLTFPNCWSLACASDLPLFRNYNHICYS